ncbi:molybdopterin molybdotransferase MoeA [Shinella sp. CPCC 100929]|uniref:Molybdopterin molybdenumtransferase n=1 Tax=Shinella lacus TaxID=2654216 RepID=A0ABT1R124_9HYPH|nr:gephyrin-like molybdotransferase Glp [Shinella lacus]MCQ4628873.1 molybdopterin molybdotransferase MoeA [Shinella lacus]
MGLDQSFGKSAISVEEARRLINSGMHLVGEETIGLHAALGRVTATALTALTTSPPFDVSAMDGYAVRAAEISSVGMRLPLSGASRAGTPVVPTLSPGTCMRIFTGAPVPIGADAIVIQEDVEADGGRIVFQTQARPGLYIRPAGLNFKAGDEIIPAGRTISARDIGLSAAAGHGTVAVRRRPRIAVLSTGDELANDPAGAGAGRIFDANRPALLALVAAWGGEPLDLGIALDDDAAITTALQGLDADLLLVTGGASVGDHDRVRPALQALGLSFNFWKIRMRPGKPLMFGALGSMPVLGLPGNPVSALVCALLFLKSAIAAMTGGDASGPRFETARLTSPIGKTGERDDYLRATVTASDGELTVAAFTEQDSSMLALLAASNALLFRSAGAPAAAAGETVKVVRFDTLAGY